MTYGRNKPLTAEMNEKHKKTAISQIYSGTKTQINIPGKVTIITIIAIRGILTT